MNKQKKIEGNWLKHIRLRDDSLRQCDLAEITGFDKRTISVWETKGISPRRFRQILVLMGEPEPLIEKTLEWVKTHRPPSYTYSGPRSGKRPQPQPKPVRKDFKHVSASWFE